MPDNFVYHYQALIAGILALLAGLLGFYAAWRTLTQRQKEQSARQTNFVVSIVVKLKIFEADVSDLFDAFSHHADSMQNDDSYYPTPDSYDNLRLPAVLQEIWKVDVGLPLEVILDIEELADSVLSAREAIDEFGSTLKQVRTPRETPKQLELAGFHDLVGRSQNHLYQLACRARDWVAEVRRTLRSHRRT